VQNDFPVNVLFWSNVDAGVALIGRHPDTRFIIDHMGILQPSAPPAPPQPWADLPKVVELGNRKNAVIRSPAPARCRKSRIRSRTSGTRFSASSMPGASIAAYGAPTGRAHSRSSTTNKESSRS
jgi:predicted TIM-barrel fold metal-dependent hydrolase